VGRGTERHQRHGARRLADRLGRQFGCALPRRYNVGLVDATANGRPAKGIVLLVDDHADTRDLYVQVLEIAGYETHAASDGLEAWEKANAVPPDVIVTDVGLPRMDGIELCARLRANEATARIPIIALTGFAEATIAERARALGIVKVLVKPCSPELLLAEIRAACAV
jgi:two-component system cell cycle response regulator DivK